MSQPQPVHSYSHPPVTPTGIEKKMSCDSLIISKADLSSIITYANKDFCLYSGYSTAELIGQPQNIIRHPDMPRAIFNLMWDHLKQQQEFFGYIKNMAKDGSHYWAFANIAPTYINGQHIGYMSARRCPSPAALEVIIPLYEKMTRVEQGLAREQQIPMSSAVLLQAINKEFTSYAEFALSL